MIRDLDVPIRDLDGVPIPQEPPKTLDHVSAAKPDEPPPPVMIKTVACHALLNSRSGDEKLAADDHLKRYKLAARIHDGGRQELSLDELGLIKRLAATMYGSLVVGQLCLWCEAEAEPDPQPESAA